MTSWARDGCDNPHRMHSSDFGRLGHDDQRSGDNTMLPGNMYKGTQPPYFSRPSTPPVSAKVGRQTTSDMGSPNMGASGEDNDRANKAQTKLFECRWKIITEQMSQISALVDGMAVLRQEVQHLKADVMDKHDEFTVKFSDCLVGEHHAGLTERIDDVEKMIADAAEKHNHGIDDAHRKLSEHHQFMTERAEKQNEMVTSQGGLEDRIKSIERLLIESGHRHETHTKDANNAFDKIVSAHNRVQDLEKAIADLQVAHNDSISMVEKKFTHVHGTQSSQGESIDRHTQMLDDMMMRHPQFADDITRKMQDLETSASQDHEKLEALEQSTKNSLDAVEVSLQETKDKQASEVENVEQRLQNWGENFTITVEKQLGALGDSFGEHCEKFKALEAAHLAFKELQDKSKAEASAEHSKLKDAHDELAESVAGLHAEKDRMGECQEIASQQLSALQRTVSDDNDKNERVMQDVYKHIDGVQNENAEFRAQVETQFAGLLEKHAEHVHDFELVQKGIAALHSGHAEEVESRDKRHTSMEERISTLEQFFGDCMDKHVRDYEQTKQQVQEQCGSLSDLKNSVEGLTAASEVRFMQLEDALGEHGDAHTQHKQAQSELDRKVSDLLNHHHNAKQTHREHIASISERVDYVEGMIGDHADQHAKELAAHQQRGQDLHGTAMGNFTDLRDKHDKQKREVINPLVSRFDQLEQVVKELFGSHVNKSDFESMKTKVEEVNTHSKNVHGAFIDSENQRNRMHGGLEKRLELLEGKVNDTGGNMARELQVASSVAQEQLEIAARVSSITKDLNRDLETMEAANGSNKDLNRGNLKLSSSMNSSRYQSTSPSPSKSALSPRAFGVTTGTISRPVTSFSLGTLPNGQMSVTDPSPKPRSDWDVAIDNLQRRPAVDEEHPGSIKLAAVAAMSMDKDIDKLRSQNDAAQIREVSQRPVNSFIGRGVNCG